MGRSEANSFKIDAPDFHALASNQERCVKNGYLVKQGQFNTASRKKRWFELAEHWPLLYYFDSDDGGKALGVIMLKAATYELAAQHLRPHGSTFVVLTSEGVVRVRKRRALEAVVDAALARTEPWMPSPMAALFEHFGGA